MTRLYCLECNTFIGHSSGEVGADSDHGLGVCQTCAQHGRGDESTREAGPGGDADPSAWSPRRAPTAGPVGQRH